MVAGRFDQPPPPQQLERGLHGAFGQAGRVREIPQTQWHRFPFRPSRLGVEAGVCEIRRGLFVVANDIAHQDIEYVIIDRKSFSETRHG
jgi:hypothetical protein